MNKFDEGINQAQKDLEEHGIQALKSTVNDYMEDPIIECYDEDTKQFICGYCSFCVDYAEIKERLGY